MAKLTKETFIESLKEMTILEIKELVDAMKEEFGVDPTALAVAAPVAGAKIQVIKVLRELTGLGLKEAKDLADNGGAVKEGLAAEEAEKVKAQLVEAGAEVELK